MVLLVAKKLLIMVLLVFALVGAPFLVPGTGRTRPNPLAVSNLLEGHDASMTSYLAGATPFVSLRQACMSAPAGPRTLARHVGSITETPGRAIGGARARCCAAGRGALA